MSVHLFQQWITDIHKYTGTVSNWTVDSELKSLLHIRTCLVPQVNLWQRDVSVLHQVADSIVRKARESLERAIQLVKETARWQAQVVYGDTDSLFIVLPGRSKDEAFVIGQEIADAVTDMFPKPMKLRFEKVTVERDHVLVLKNCYICLL